MKIKHVTDIGHSYMIFSDDGFGVMQRKHPKTAADYPLERREEMLCAMCVRMIELQVLIDSTPLDSRNELTSNPEQLPS